MEMLKKLIICAFISTASLMVLIHAQSQSGFISIDCGIPEDSSYTDKLTGINYTSDANFIETGVSNNISPEYIRNSLEQQFMSVRSFPEGKRNCYTLKLAYSDTTFLIRARFMYGNYDGKGKVPSFNLLLEADLWDSVELTNASTIVTKEIIHIPQKNYIYVCLENTGSGTPFISSLELRRQKNSTYGTDTGSLLLVWRLDFGSTTNKPIRYEDDVYDRIWSPYNCYNCKSINTSLKVFPMFEYDLPSTVLQTAAVPADGNYLQFISFKPTDPSFQYYVFIHFAEVEKLSSKQIREFDIYFNGKKWAEETEYTTYLIGDTYYGPLDKGEDHIALSLNKTENSTLPPIINAFEIYRVQEFQQLLTNQRDVDAIVNIKAKYGVKRNWQGDPCAPKLHLWQGLNCNYDDYDPPSIISLNLSSSGIAGDISYYISSLTSIQILDLSNNSLTGRVPDFLSELQNLTVLNLTGNRLEGSIPVGLMEMKKNGLILSVDGNPNLCLEASCIEKKHFIVPLLAAAVSTSALSTVMAILWIFKRRNREDKWCSTLIIVGAALLVPLFCYLCYSVWRSQQAKVESIINQEKILRDFGDNLSPPSADGKGITQDKDQSMKHELNIFNFQTIAAATNNFSSKNVLGKGGFGAVYKGTLLDGQEIAIKRLSRNSNQGIEEFQNEAKLIAKLQHTNLVRLIGCSLQAEERILIYEYMPNKSLDFFIFDSHRKKLLNWKTRFNIIERIAQGLIYLHKYSRLKVIHRDLKASNILLDGQMNPKISDFGMARTFGVNDTIANTNKIVGTYGYMSPEYAMNGIVSIKTDVYSFGVLVLEIVSGKKNTRCYHTEHPLNLVGYAWQLRNEGKGLELRDPTLDESCSPDEVLRCLHVGLLCVQDQAIDRPTMPDVVSMLTNETILLPAPKQPAFYISDTTEESENPGKNVEDCSINNVTISVMDAR